MRHGCGLIVHCRIVSGRAQAASQLTTAFEAVALPGSSPFLGLLADPA
jgi:hypothetical protein